MVVLCSRFNDTFCVCICFLSLSLYIRFEGSWILAVCVYLISYLVRKQKIWFSAMTLIPIISLLICSNSLEASNHFSLKCELALQMHVSIIWWCVSCLFKATRFLSDVDKVNSLVTASPYSPSLNWISRLETVCHFTGKKLTIKTKVSTCQSAIIKTTCLFCL